MRKQEILKAPCMKVFPLVGSPEEGKNKKIRTLRLVGFRLSPSEAIATASALLMKAQEAGVEKNTVVDMVARRRDGSSVVMVQTAIQPPEKRKAVKKEKVNHSAPATPATPAKGTKEAAASGATTKTRKKQPAKAASAATPAAPKKDSESSATAAA